MAKQQENYLEYVPVVSEKNEWEADKNGRVTVHMVHKGFYATIAQKLFGRPRVSHIDLDEQGSFVFRQIDGSRTVGEIAQLVGQQFPDEENVLYARLIKYMQILRNNRFIYFRGKDKMPK